MTLGGSVAAPIVVRPEAERSTGVAVVMVHGGSWRFGSPSMLADRAQLLALQGYTAVVVAYRQLAESVAWPTPLDDVIDTIAWVQANAEDLGVDPERIVIEGFSAGGHLALLATAAPRVAGVAALALLYPAVWFSADVPAVVEPVRSETGVDLRATATGVLSAHLVLGDDFPVSAVTGLKFECAIGRTFPPSFLVHGTGDRVIPYQSSVRLHDFLTARGLHSELRIHAGVGHAFESDPTWAAEVQADVCRFFDRVLNN
ncbi:alpha/beta hydrolase [Amycolatopsis sp. NPDC051372]|uniref:alpha/beta hydrolase n=1 Tax=Amycolatopsis sp. NPDC051372 TaxID=3155669 RepID=UPI00341FFE14